MYDKAILAAIETAITKLSQKMGEFIQDTDERGTAQDMLHLQAQISIKLLNFIWYGEETEQNFNSTQSECSDADKESIDSKQDLYHQFQKLQKKINTLEKAMWKKPDIDDSW